MLSGKFGLNQRVVWVTEPGLGCLKSTSSRSFWRMVRRGHHSLGFEENQV